MVSHLFFKIPCNIPKLCHYIFIDACLLVQILCPCLLLHISYEMPLTASCISQCKVKCSRLIVKFNAVANTVIGNDVKNRGYGAYCTALQHFGTRCAASILPQKSSVIYGKSKATSADKVTPSRPEKLRFGQHLTMQLDHLCC